MAATDVVIQQYKYNSWQLNLIYTNQEFIIADNYDIFLQQLLLRRKHSNFERMRDCNCSSILGKGQLIKWIRL